MDNGSLCQVSKYVWSNIVMKVQSCVYMVHSLDECNIGPLELLTEKMTRALYRSHDICVQLRLYVE